MKESDSVKDFAIIVGIASRNSELDECERSLDELERLLDTAGGEVYARVVQIKDTLDPRTCIGAGKVKEIADICASGEVSLVIFDFELSPAQIRNLENDIGSDVKVIDRSMLILDIFALHATSGEGKLQVELAQLKYSAPRLMGHGTQMSRLGGGIGTRGPGESKLETDRRHLKERVYALERRLDELESNRAIMRAQRDRSGLVKIALIGYTNAGKSTLLNALTGAGVLAEDKLFATLDATTRKFELPCGESVLLTDTVGFIRKLPHHLVKAFKSTLDEVVYADILLIVTDVNDPEALDHIRVTEEILEELGASGKSTIYVYNKCDMLDGTVDNVSENTVMVSGLNSMGLDSLIELIEKEIHKFKRKYKLLLPYSEQSVLSAIYNSYSVEDVEYLDTGISLYAIFDERGRGMYQRYIVSE